MNSIGSFLPSATPFMVWIGIIAMVIYFEIRGKPTTVTLLPYQRGILFKRGFPVRDVGPGKHRVWTGTELLVHGDMRPITVNYENRVVSLKDGLVALHGFSASVQVQDVRKAIYSARDYTSIPPSVLLRCTRRHLNACSGKSLNLERDTVVNRIAEDAKARLNTVGFKLISFRITQLVIGTPQPSSPKADLNLSPIKG
jgi:hypothetical protein